MTSRDFCYWLQGLFELAKPSALDAEQTELVKRHLALVFVHEIDPSAGPPTVQAKLNEIHEGDLPEAPLSPEAQALLDAFRKAASDPPPRIGGGHGPHCPGTTVYRC